MINTEKLVSSCIVSFIAGIVILMMLFWFTNTSNMYYRQGQIDALTGKINYYLKVNEDSTRTWERNAH